MYSRIFFIADTHFGHNNVIQYENRPFASVEEMDKKIVSNWNSVVTGQDLVFLLGDFSMYNKEISTNICNSLKGDKVLIKGNHDRKSNKFYLDCGFRSVIEYPIVFQKCWMLSHRPMYVNESMPYFNIFEHVHNHPIF